MKRLRDPPPPPLKPQLSHVLKSDAKPLSGNCTGTMTKMVQMELWNIQGVSSWDFASVDISHFFKTKRVSLHPTRETLHLLRVLKKVTSPLGSFATNSKSLEEHETCEDQKEPVVNIIPHNCFSSLLNTQICAAIATNDLGKLSWLSWVCSMTTLHSQAVYIRCTIITHFSPYRPLERTKMIQYLFYEKEKNVFNLQPDWKTCKHDNGIHIRFP